MLLFYCAPADALADIRQNGLRGGVALKRSFDEAKAACSQRLLVIDASGLEDNVSWEGKGPFPIERVPAAAIVNLHPFLPAAGVVAAGGYVVRQGEKEPEVLMIYRRGLWDIPKGKQDPGENLEECALREVREEVGIAQLQLVRPLGTTLHGYERNGQYKVKTTHWYQMLTPENDFVPQEEEQIERVCWMPWSEAVDKVGFESFRRHMLRVAPLIVEAKNFL